MEEKRNVNKNLLAIFRIYLKLIPIIIAIIYFLNTTLSYFNLYPKVLNYLVFILLIVFVYIASYLLKFCEYHRMFLHYFVVIHIINIIITIINSRILIYTFIFKCHHPFRKQSPFIPSFC